MRSACQPRLSIPSTSRGSSRGVGMSRGGMMAPAQSLPREAWSSPTGAMMWLRCLRIASELLGHSDPLMTERFYIQAETVQASKRHQDVILAMRKEIRSRAKAKD